MPERGPEPSPKELEQTRRFIVEDVEPADGPVIAETTELVDREAAQLTIASMIVEELVNHPDGMIYEEFMQVMGRRIASFPTRHMDFIPALDLVRYRFDGKRIFFAG